MPLRKSEFHHRAGRECFTRQQDGRICGPRPLKTAPAQLGLASLGESRARARGLLGNLPKYAGDSRRAELVAGRMWSRRGLRQDSRLLGRARKVERRLLLQSALVSSLLGSAQDLSSCPARQPCAKSAPTETAIPKAQQREATRPSRARVLRCPGGGGDFRTPGFEKRKTDHRRRRRHRYQALILVSGQIAASHRERVPNCACSRLRV